MSPNLPDNKSKPTTVTGGSAKDSGKNSKPPASSQKTQARPGTARSMPRKANAPASTAKVASPAKSDKSARSGTSSEASSPKTRATRYCCPLKDCTFSIDKAGLRGGGLTHFKNTQSDGRSDEKCSQRILQIQESQGRGWCIKKFYEYSCSACETLIK